MQAPSSLSIHSDSLNLETFTILQYTEFLLCYLAESFKKALSAGRPRPTAKLRYFRKPGSLVGCIAFSPRWRWSSPNSLAITKLKTSSNWTRNTTNAPVFLPFFFFFFFNPGISAFKSHYILCWTWVLSWPFMSQWIKLH